MLIRQRGFSLVELMVALVVGMIVVGAVLALILSIIRSNNQTMQATRLTQELRATAAVIAADLRRARGVTDPLAATKLVGGNPYKTIDTSSAGCVRFGYDGAVGGPWHVIRRDAATNKVVLAAAATSAAATCTLAGSTLSSAQVNITGLTFEPEAGQTPEQVRSINITVTGALAGVNPGMAGVTRTFTQTVFVRSIGTGN